MAPTPPARLAQILLMLCVPILLVATPLYVLFTPGYVHWMYDRPGFPPSFRFDTAERSRIADAIMAYMRDDDRFDEMATATTDEGTTALLPSETQHLVDVRQVVRGFLVADTVALVVAIACAAFLLRTGPSLIPPVLRQGVCIVAGLVAVIGVTAAIDFDLFFTQFHGVFFDAGTWTFRYEDTLIQLYPIEFWIRTVAYLLAMVTALAALLLGVAAGIERRVRRVAS